MEDPRIISALFIFLKMAYYNVLINIYRKQPIGLRHGNMDLFTRGITKRKRKNRVRGK